MARRMSHGMARWNAENTNPWSVVDDSVHRRREQNAMTFAARARAARMELVDVR